MKFSRGYDKVRDKVSKGGKYIMCCQNCNFFRKETGDEEEVCQNPDVLQYDIIITENSVYCLKWQPYKFTTRKKSLFKQKRW